MTMRRDFLFVGCEGGHDWQGIGGCNAGCHNLCSCSVPVNFCRRCGDHDYGINADAERVRRDCEAQWGTPSERGWSAVNAANGENGERTDR